MGASMREDRSRRLREAVARQGWDLIVVVGDAWRSDYLRFAIDVTPMEGLMVALVPAQGDAVVYVSHPGEQRRLQAELPSLKVECEADPAAAARQALQASPADRIGMAPSHAVPWALGQAVPAAALHDATALMDALMVRKSAAEADIVARATRLADDGYAVFREAAQPGKTEYALIGELEAWFRSQGCIENFMIMGSGGTEVRTMRPPGTRVLQHGDMVTTELTPCLDGYYAQICRTLVIGTPTRAQLQAYAVYEEALEAGIAVVRPGATHADVARAQNDVFRRHGLAEYITSKYTRVRGHGMGLYVDGPHVLEDVEQVLEPDMTLVVHPNTYHPVAGYIVLGDTVRVTDSGCEVLTRTTRSLTALSTQGGT